MVDVILSDIETDDNGKVVDNEYMADLWEKLKKLGRLVSIAKQNDNDQEALDEVQEYFSTELKTYNDDANVIVTRREMKRKEKMRSDISEALG